jgi:hypothetical protein
MQGWKETLSKKETMDESQFRRRCLEDFDFYARHNLKIRTKAGGIAPLVFNRAQLYINARLDEQRAKTGRVRAFIVKGRQQGCSTLVSARYYHRVTHSIGYKVFILTHLADATNNLFKMVKRYHDGMPDQMRVATEADSAKELKFSAIDSGYAVGTARSAGSGRSETVQLFHGSEVAYWPEAEENASGVLQAVPDAPGTEVVMESTANGLGNYFHKRCMEAQVGGDGYQLIFVPWYWQPEYAAELPEGGMKLEEEEVGLKARYGITDQQLYWRRLKIKELGSQWRFKQEYPFNVDEAFQASGRESFIPVESIERARKMRIAVSSGAVVLGIDPALTGDRTSFIVRQGRKILHSESFEKIETFDPIYAKVIELDKICKSDWSGRHLDWIFVDVIGIGFGVVDTLKRMGYTERVTGVNSALPALNGDKYANKRAEMWGELRDWLADAGGADIPDKDSLQTDLMAPKSGPESVDGNGRTKLQSKKEIKKDGFRSPDEADALALTFAHSVEEPTRGGADVQFINIGVV